MEGNLAMPLPISTTVLAAVESAVKKTVKRPRRLYTLGEYLEREQNSTELHEYHNGIITKLPMARGPHNDIAINISTTLKIQLRETGKKYYMRGGQQAIYFPLLNASVYPDALVISETPEYFDTNEVLLINPLLIVEVLSKSTQKYDRVEKFNEYRTLESFKEYVLIDQKRCFIETRFRVALDTWQFTQFSDMEAMIPLQSLGVSIAVKEVYENVAF